MGEKLNRTRPQRAVRVGVDTGGTFTDFLYTAHGRTEIFKLPSTPADPSLAITEGLRRIAEATGARIVDLEIVHGTTVGTNALLQRRGAHTALITTAGFEDVLAIGRQARPRLYDLDAVRPEPLVPRGLRFGVRERVAASGEVIEELDEASLASLVKKLQRAKVESIAISLLFSFVHPAHEERLARALAETLGAVPLSISHLILPEYREYERTSTVVINAYLQPLMSAYLNRLSGHGPGALRVMQSSGGSVSARVAAAEPVRTILSGPAGGVVGALAAARAAGIQDIITFDMGGTSTDVSLCARGELRLTHEATVAGLPVAVPVLDIHTVGAGGGSMARVDVGGSLRVGPESAGADPGPACYGRSLLPTVTDANLALGRFGGANLLGGSFPIDAARAHDALTTLAHEMRAVSGGRVSARKAALGVVRVVNAGMERALRAVSVERGYDPRAFTLISFGGAGGLHAVELARALRIPRVVVPPRPGALAAHGALASEVVKDLSRTVMLDAGAASESLDALARAFRELEHEGRTALRLEGFAHQQQRHEWTVNARYQGQSFELEIKWRPENKKGATLDELITSFHDAHQARYGYAQKSNRVEIVSARVRSMGAVEKLEEEKPTRIKLVTNKKVAPQTRARVCLTGESEELVAVYQRDLLPPGVHLQSPCIVVEYSSTTLIPTGARAKIDEHRNLVIEP